MRIDFRESKTISIPFGIKLSELIDELTSVEQLVGEDYTLCNSWREGDVALGIRFSKTSSE